MDRISRKLEPLIKCYSEIHQNSQDVYWIGYRDFQYVKYLSPEAKCAFFLLHGKTAKQIAKALTLSPRTVEEILCNIKRKLGVIYRSDLCEALIESDFPVIITGTA